MKEASLSHRKLNSISYPGPPKPNDTNDAPRKKELFENRVYTYAFIFMCLFTVNHYLNDRYFVTSAGLIRANTMYNYQVAAPEVIETKREYDDCRELHFNTHTVTNVCNDMHDGELSIALIEGQLDFIKATMDQFVPHVENIAMRNHTTVLIPNALCHPDDKLDKGDITLTTQMGVDKVKRLAVLAQRWNGPISVVIRMSHLEDLDKLKALLPTYGDRLGQVAFHIYFESTSLAYPQNLLRNLALNQVKSDYWIILDVDLFPSPMDTHRQMRGMLQRRRDIRDLLHNKHVFVLPSFDTVEVVPDEDVDVHHPYFPETKAEAIEFLYGPKPIIEIFHIAWPPCQQDTNYTQWIRNDSDEIYEIHFDHWGYEPYTMGAIDGLPRLHQYFRGFGLDKLSFTPELQAAGYRFAAFRDFFVFHVNHPSSYGSFKEVTEKVNEGCIRYFMEHLEGDYGVGREGDEKVTDWWRWEKQRDRGDAYRENDKLHLVDLSTLELTKDGQKQ